MAKRGDGVSVRAPKDDEEARRARLMVAFGQGQSVAAVIEEITGTAPSEELVETVKDRLKAAAEDGLPFDLASFLELYSEWQEAWA